MAHYQLVDKHAIQHHNEYYELRTTQTEQPHSLFFTTNDENLEEVAAAIVNEHFGGVNAWTIIPHRKDE